MIVLINFLFTFQTNEPFGLYDDDDDHALFHIYLMRENPHVCLYFMCIFFIIS